MSSPFAFNLGSVSAYLDGDRIIEIAKKEGCQGIHPGYGFVSTVQHKGWLRRLMRLLYSLVRIPLLHENVQKPDWCLSGRLGRLSKIWETKGACYYHRILKDNSLIE